MTAGPRFFPIERRGVNAREPVPTHTWRPEPPAGERCFGDYNPDNGVISLQALCPISGWSEPREVRPDVPWHIFESHGAGHCGNWASYFMPIGCLGRRSSLVLLPISPEPFAMVLMHCRGTQSRNASAPTLSTIACTLQRGL